MISFVRAAVALALEGGLRVVVGILAVPLAVAFATPILVGLVQTRGLWVGPPRADLGRLAVGRRRQGEALAALVRGALAAAILLFVAAVTLAPLLPRIASVGSTPPLMVFGAMVLMGELNGLTTSGDFSKTAPWQVQPLLYLVGELNGLTKAADFKITALLRDGSMTVTNSYPEGVVTVFSSPAITGPWVPLVSKIEWTNPHMHLYVDVTDAAGKVTTYNLELTSPNAIQRLGWNKNDLVAGEKVTFSAHTGKVVESRGPMKTPAIVLEEDYEHALECDFKVWAEAQHGAVQEARRSGI